jgi:hypothetical protein
VRRIDGVAAALGDTSIATSYGDTNHSGIGYSSKVQADPPFPRGKFSPPHGFISKMGLWFFARNSRSLVMED